MEDNSDYLTDLQVCSIAGILSNARVVYFARMFLQLSDREIENAGPILRAQWEIIKDGIKMWIEKDPKEHNHKLLADIIEHADVDFMLANAIRGKRLYSENLIDIAKQFTEEVWSRIYPLLGIHKADLQAFQPLPDDGEAFRIKQGILKTWANKPGNTATKFLSILDSPGTEQVFESKDVEEIKLLLGVKTSTGTLAEPSDAHDDNIAEGENLLGAVGPSHTQVSGKHGHKNADAVDSSSKKRSGTTYFSADLLGWFGDSQKHTAVINNYKNQNSDVHVAVLSSGIDDKDLYFSERIVSQESFVENEDVHQTAHDTEDTHIIEGIARYSPDCKFHIIKVVSEKGVVVEKALQEGFKYLQNEENAQKIRVVLLAFCTNSLKTVFKAKLKNICKGRVILAPAGVMQGSGEMPKLCYPAINDNVIAVGAHDKCMQLCTKFSAGMDVADILALDMLPLQVAENKPREVQYLQGAPIAASYATAMTSLVVHVAEWMDKNHSNKGGCVSRKSAVCDVDVMLEILKKLCIPGDDEELLCLSPEKAFGGEPKQYIQICIDECIQS